MKFEYEIEKYNFVREVSSLYDNCMLDEIHTQWIGSKQYDLLDAVVEDQITVYHKEFYSRINTTNFYEIYHSFMKDVIAEIINEDFLYQRIPTFRVHQPDNIAVAKFHKDCDYSHTKDEINFYLPLTKAWGTNTIWVESSPGKKDYSPIEADIGECVMWKGATLLHGNKVNDTCKSRVSVDFRVLPVSCYKDVEMYSITNQTKMVVDQYWERL